MILFITCSKSCTCFRNTLSLNPGNILPLKIYYPFTVDATVSPENATNKLLKWSVENITGNGKFDKNGEVFPEKGGVFAVIAEALMVQA